MCVCLCKTLTYHAFIKNTHSPDAGSLVQSTMLAMKSVMQKALRQARRRLRWRAKSSQKVTRRLSFCRTITKGNTSYTEGTSYHHRRQHVFCRSVVPSQKATRRTQRVGHTMKEGNTSSVVLSYHHKRQHIVHRG